MQTPLSRLLAAATVLIASTGLATAANITWGAPQDITGALSQISTAGTTVGAFNPYGNTVTVNGIEFVAIDLWPGGGTSNALLEFAGATTSSTTGDPGYDGLLRTAETNGDSALGNPTQIAAIRLDTLVSLTPGKRYQIQIWWNDQKSNIDIQDRVMTYGSSDDPSLTVTGGLVPSDTPLGPTVALEADPGDNYTGANDTAIGQFVLGEFTADGGPLYLLVQGSHPKPTVTLRPHINAFQIRDLDDAPGADGIPVVSTSYDSATGEFTVVFTAETGKTYSVYGGSDLSDLASWPEVSTSALLGDGGNLSFSHAAGVVRFFYQVRED